MAAIGGTTIAVKNTSYKASKAPVKPSRATRSMFDMSSYHGKEIAGELPKSRAAGGGAADDVEIAAFSSTARPPTKRVTPKEFLKKGGGTGGTTRRDAIEKAKAMREGKADAGSKRGPPPAGAFVQRSNPPNTELRRLYERGDLPLSILHRVRRRLQWTIEVTRLDLFYYLPVFMDGIREKEEPYCFIAESGTYDLLMHCPESKILPVVPLLILPLKRALNTRDKEVVVRAIKVIQALVGAGEYIGSALVPYFRQLLPVFNLYLLKTKNLGDKIDYGQRKREDLGDLIRETLEMLEIAGGEGAMVNIKYLIPTYTSAVFE